MGDRDDAMREELGRVLASEAFLASPMLSAFLSYVVEETLAGREDRLKAYAIAVGALGRPDDFDANENPLVRVQARRLRQALARHYETRGDDVAARLDLPIGTYVPILLEGEASPPPLDGDEPECSLPERPLDTEIEAVASRADTPPPAAPRADTPPPAASGSFVRRLLFLSMPVILAVGVGLGILAGRWREPPSPELPAETGSTVVEARRKTPPETMPSPGDERRNLDASRVLPLLVVEVEVRNAALFAFDGEIFRNRIESFVQRFDDTVVVTRRSADFPAPLGQPIYRLSFLVDKEGASTNLYYRLLHAGDERVVGSGVVALSEPPSRDGSKEGPGLETSPDLALVRDIVQLHGTITRDIANLPDPSPELACLSKAWHYFTDSTPQNHLAARGCLESVVDRNPRLAPALTMLGAMHLSGYRQGFDPKFDDPIGRAEDLLRLATRVAPYSSASYVTLQNLYLIKGDVAAALLAGGRSVELNPGDMNAVGNYGSLLARIGRYGEALPLLKRAVANMSTPPKWLQFYTFLALNNLGRTEEADRQVAFFEGTTSTLYLTAVVVRAHRRGDEPAAAAAVAAIAAGEPDFGADPRAFQLRRGLAATVVDRLMADFPSLSPPPH